MENMEMNNTAEMIAEEAVEMIKIDPKKVGIGVGIAAATGAVVYVVVKKGIPFTKKKINNIKTKREVKKVEKAAKKAKFEVVE